MREIKFRAWDSRSSQFATVTLGSRDYAVDLKYPKSRKIGFGEDVDVDLGNLENFSFDNRLKWMQYTGLKDKNGVEIYEGDVVAFNADFVPIEFAGYRLAEVRWSDYQVGFVLHTHEKDYIVADETDEFDSKAEIIGNIYENPDILQSRSER